MAEEFQTGICGGNYWWNNINSTRSVFPLSSSPCSVAANDAGGIGYSTWQTDMVELKATTRACADHEEESQETNNNNNMVSDRSSLGFLDATKPLSLLQQSSTEPASGNNGGSSILMDSTLHMMGFGLSSNWNNHSLFSRCSGKPAESNFHSMLQEETGTDSSSNSPITEKDWRPKSFSSSSFASTVDGGAFKQMNHQDLCGGGFPIGSASYGYPSTLIQSLYDPHHIPDHPQPLSLFTNRSMAYSSTATANYGASSNELSPTSWSKPSCFLKQQMPSGLHFSNNTPFWNASASAEALNDMRAGVFSPSSQPRQYQTSSLINDKSNFPCSLIIKPKSEEDPDSASAVKKSVGEPAIKRQKIDQTPSPLPTFKVRKEKLGDRITALQQLVSPFGKTDTASVLHEAIDYIKYLHGQVSVLSTPYMKNGAPIQNQQGSDLKEFEGPKQDLRSRGLCLVPISSTFPVTNETTADFLTPSFGGALIR